MNLWENEELLKRYAPTLLGNDFDFQRQLYNTNADAGVYPEIKIDAPMKQAGKMSPWDSLNSIVDLDAVTQQMEAERPQTGASLTGSAGNADPVKDTGKKSFWAKLGDFATKALPIGLMVSGAGFGAPLAIGAAMDSYNKAKKEQAQNEFNNNLDLQKLKLLIDQFKETQSQNGRSQLNEDRTQVWKEYTDTLDRQEKKDEREELGRRWQTTFDQTAGQNAIANAHWDKNYELENKKLDADTMLQQGKLTIDEWYRRKQLEVEQQELSLKHDLGYGELGVKRAALDDGTVPGKDNTVKGNTATSHFNQFASMKTRYKRAADYQADLKRYQKEIVAKIGLKNYQALLKDADDYAIEAGDQVSADFKPGKNKKPVQSPIRSYIQYMMTNNAW